MTTQPTGGLADVIALTVVVLVIFALWLYVWLQERKTKRALHVLSQAALYLTMKLEGPEDTGDFMAVSILLNAMLDIEEGNGR